MINNPPNSIKMTVVRNNLFCKNESSEW